MSHLTQQERTAVLVLAVILVAGSGTNFIAKRFPHFQTTMMRAQNLRVKADINTATMEELVRVPYIGEATARKIIEYRTVHGPFRSLDDLRRIPGIVYHRVISYLKV